MTVVVGCRFLTSVMIFADCRVSYGESVKVDDNLRKLYQIGPRVVLGFAGPLAGARRVLEVVRNNTRHYRRPPVAVNLLRDIRRWIHHEYRLLPDKDRQGLSFILAAVEPSRTAKSRKPAWIPSAPELWIIRLPPFDQNVDRLNNPTGNQVIIGIDEEEERRTQILNDITKVLSKFFGFSKDQPRLQATVIANALMATMMQNRVKGVGGLFQGAILDASGVQWIAYGTPEVALEVIDGEYVQRDHVSGSEIPLRTIWEWCEEWRPYHDAGGAGIFEDKELREASESAGK